jgi:hypothetical protein
VGFDTDDPAVIAQAGRDAADLVRYRWDGDDNGAGEVLDRTEPSLAADHLAYFTVALLTADADIRGKIAADPRKMLRAWRQSFGPAPEERVPWPRRTGRFGSDNARDAIALIEATARNDTDASAVVLANADIMAVAVHLAAVINDLVPTDVLAGRLATYREAAGLLDDDT